MQNALKAGLPRLGRLRKPQRIVGTLLLLSLFAANVVVTQAAFTSRVPGANDFFMRWEGARAFWLDGLNPYSDEVTRRIEIGMYGRPAQAPETPGEFVYPFYTVFTLWPLVGLSYDWVQAVWIVLLEFTIVGIALMSTSLLRWRAAGPLALAAVILFALLFYYSARAIVLGQYAILAAACVIGTFVAMRSGRDALAGVLLACSTIKPPLVFLIIPYVLVWSMARRRWQVVWGLAASMAILAGLSFVLLPSWLSDFLRQVANYPSYTETGASPVWVIVQFYLGWGDASEAIISGVLGLALIGVWAPTLRDASWGTFQWVSSLTLIVSNLIAVRSATTHYVILYPALWLVAKAIVDRLPRRGPWIVLAGGLALLIGTWALFAATLVGNQEHHLMFLPLPIGLALAFVAWRPMLVQTAERGLSQLPGDRSEAGGRVAVGFLNR